VIFSPDDRYIASGSKDRTVRIWDARTGKQVGEALIGHTNAVWTVAFSPDGRTLASGSNDKTIRLWDVQNKEKAKLLGPPLEGHTESVWSVKFSPDGKSIVSGSADLSLRWWPSRWNQWPQMACERLENHPLFNAPESIENIDKEIVTIAGEAKAACDRKFWETD
jgi:WD40 repeat protein